MQTWQKIKNDPSILPRYLVREKVLDGIRSFFKNQHFHECETPILVPTPSAEPNLEFFKTTLKTHTGVNRDGYLISSPEYALKKLLVAGLGDIFEITKVFRNEEGVSRGHNHEFTILEWYRAQADYTHIMTDFENLFIYLVKQIRPKTDISNFKFQSEEFNLNPPWPKLSVKEAFAKYAGISDNDLLNGSNLLTIHKNKGYTQDSTTTWEQAFYQIMFNEIEPEINKLKTPVFLYDYPVSEASLSRKKASDPRVAERFEVFLAGLELGNAFSELNDANEQESRLLSDLSLRKKMGKLEFPLDTDFIDALKIGMPPSAGIAVGVDRLVMLLANTETIADTLFFPVAEMFDLE